MTALVCLWLVFGVQPAQAQATNQVGLVVLHGDGRVVTRCVEFSEPAINGYDVLQRSGLDLNVEVAGMGAAVCRLDHEGCTYPQESCFCQAEGETYTYWSYWQGGEAGWAYSQQGAAGRQVGAGALEGWVWGSGAADSAHALAAITFADVCAPPTTTPTETPTATETPSPTATAIPATLTATPSETPTPPPTPSPSATQPPPPSATSTPILTATSTGTATPAPPHIELFAVDRPMLDAGQPARISWTVGAATQVILQGNGADLSLGGVGNLEVYPLQTTSYVLVARNPAGEVNATLLITVNPAAPVATATPLIAPLPVVTATATATTGVAVAAGPVPPAATPAPPAPALPTATALPAPSATAIPAQSAEVETTATATVIVLAESAPPAQAASLVAPTVVWPTATPDPAQAQLQLAIIVGGVALMVVVPMGVLAVAAVFWVMRSKA